MQNPGKKFFPGFLIENGELRIIAAKRRTSSQRGRNSRKNSNIFHFQFSIIHFQAP